MMFSFRVKWFAVGNEQVGISFSLSKVVYIFVFAAKSGLDWLLFVTLVGRENDL